MTTIDTNVLVYTIDSQDPLKQATAIQLTMDLAADGETVLLWQVACEFLGKLRQWQQRGKLSERDAQTAFQLALASFPLHFPDRVVLDFSLDMFQRISLSHWDSMLLAACIHAKIDTEDLSHGVSYDTVQVINPFLP